MVLWLRPVLLMWWLRRLRCLKRSRRLRLGMRRRVGLGLRLSLLLLIRVALSFEAVAEIRKVVTRPGFPFIYSLDDLPLLAGHCVRLRQDEGYRGAGHEMAQHLARNRLALTLQLIHAGHLPRGLRSRRWCRHGLLRLLHRRACPRRGILRERALRRRRRKSWR